MNTEPQKRVMNSITSITIEVMSAYMWKLVQTCLYCSTKNCYKEYYNLNLKIIVFFFNSLFMKCQNDLLPGQRKHIFTFIWIKYKVENHLSFYVNQEQNMQFDIYSFSPFELTDKFFNNLLTLNLTLS